MRPSRSAAAPLALAALLLLGGCSADAADSATAGSLPHPGEVDEGDPRTGPRKPEKGTWYRYDLPTHCGVDTARFGGRWWKLSVLHTDLDSEVRGDRVDWGFHHTPGYMRLESARAAVFQTAGRPPVGFRPTDGPAHCA